MDTQRLTAHSFLRERRFVIAGSAAILLHMGMLLHTLPPSIGLSEFPYQPLSVQLQQIASTPPIPAMIETPKPSVLQEPLKQKQEAVHVEDEIVQNEEVISADVQAQNSSRFSAWLEQETETHLSENPQSLKDFSASFASKPINRVSRQESYKSPYGETHVVTRVGDRDVCYLDSNQHVKDEWSAGIVMFYDCDSRADTKFELP